METNPSNGQTGKAENSNETKTVSKDRLLALVDLYDYHSKLFFNVIEGITNKDANNRMGTKANHPSWIAGSLVQQRYELAKLLGEDVTATNHELFKEFKGIQDGITYPSLPEYKKDWETITPILKDALLKMEPEQLNAVSPFEMGEETSYYVGLSYMIDRESYCIGQLALYRRLMGYEAMKYS